MAPLWQWRLRPHLHNGLRIAWLVVSRIAIIYVILQAYSWFRKTWFLRPAELAYAKALDVIEFQDRLGFAVTTVEIPLQQWVLAHPALIDFFNTYYRNFKPALYLCAALCLLLAPGAFGRVFRVFLLATIIAFPWYALYPLAPPRLMDPFGFGFVDTLAVYGGVESTASGAGGANQFAAMPSMHIGWTVIAALWLAAAIPWRGIGALLGAAHVLLMCITVVVTGNHYVLDIVGGFLVAGSAVALERVLPGPWRAQFPIPDLPHSGSGDGSAPRVEGTVLSPVSGDGSPPQDGEGSGVGKSERGSGGVGNRGTTRSQRMSAQRSPGPWDLGRSEHMSVDWRLQQTISDARTGVAERERVVSRRFAWRTDRMGILAVLLVTLVAATQIVWGGTLIGQDAATQFYPWFDYLGERLRAGDIPGWNPYQFAGVPFAADPQSGWMYVPAMLVFSALPLATAVPVFIVFHLALAGTGAYALARLLGIGIGGAIVAGVTYQLAPPIYGRSVCCPAQYEVGSWMPLALVGAELAMRSHGWPWRIVGWAIAGLAVSQALGAWLGQGGYYYLLFLAAYVGYRGLIAPADRNISWPRRAGDVVLHGGAMLAIGFGLAAAGILPRLDYVGRSNVAGGEYGEENAWASEIGGVTPGMIVDRMLDPTLYYPGAAVLVLAVAAVALSHGRHATRFFAGFGIAAVILAIPWDTPLHLLLYAVLPRFEQLHEHWPDRVAIVAYLCFAILAGAAAESLAARRCDRRRILLAAGVPTVALLALISANADIPAVPIVATLLTFGFLAALVVPAAGRWVRPVLPVALAAILALDLLVAFHGATAQGPYGGFHRVDLSTYYAPGGAATFLQERMETEPGRYIGFDPAQRAVADGQLVLYRYQFAVPDTGALLVNNRGVLHGVEDAQGYNPVQPRRFVEYLTALNGHPQEYHDANIYPAGLDSPLLDLLNVRYIVIPATYPEDRLDLRELDLAFPTIYADDQVQVLENPEALPRAWIVHEARQAEREAMLPLLATGTVDPRQVALVETAPPSLGTPPAAASTVRIIRDDPDVMRLETSAEAPGLLVLSETYDPHWRATVDGEDVEIMSANFMFRAVPIPAGEHVVELRYEPVPLQIGLGISAVTVAVLVPALAWATWRVRSHRSW